MKHRTNTLMWLTAFFICGILSHTSFAQIAINDSGTSADPSAILDVSSDTKGVLLPRMTSAERTAIPNPATGLIVYDTNTNSFWFFETNWKELTTGTTNNTALWYEDNGNIINNDLANTRVGIGTDTVFAKTHIVGGIDDTNVLRIDGHPDFNQANSLGPIGILSRCHGPGSSFFEGGIGGSFFGGFIGVIGISNSSWGIHGTSRDAAGVFGSSENSYGVFGQATDGPAAVYGLGGSASPGVKGEGSTGVFGHGSSWGVMGYNDQPATSVKVGVRGHAKHSIGVVGSTENPASYAGYFVGDVFSSGLYLGSDQMLKQNIAAIQNPLAIITQLQPKKYQFRNAQFTGMNLPEGQHYGLVAQDVANVLPRLVKDTKIDLYDWDKLGRDIALAEANETIPPSTPDLLQTVNFKAVNYTELIPILIAGMQEQQNDLQNLRQNNTALQSDVEQLKQANANLNAELQSLKQAVQQILQEDNQ